jgi:3-oxoisoapionate kinase
VSLKLTFLGDDFTGSTDCLEALSLAGVRARLYLTPPESLPEDLEAVGIAGTSRTMSPEEMHEALPPIFTALKALGAPLNHYKICSTFDSSPTVGSIGCALNIGREIFGARQVPVVVGVPKLGRFVAFGNLFARVRADEPHAIFRLDRHPTMSCHPATPMHESDLAELLREQGVTLPMRSVNAPMLESDFTLDATLSELVIFDTLTEAHLKTIGKQLITLIPLPLKEEVSFLVGSSGVEYALTMAWNCVPAEVSPAPPVEKILVASGSASPVTEKQLAWAEREGWILAPLESPRVDMDVLYTARGPESVTPGRGGEALGTMLGEALARLLRRRPEITRFIVCGGDTSGFVARALGIEALEFVARAAPGSPLCRIIGGEFHGREVVFKGGQVGTEDFFEKVRLGE